ncbi:acyl-CoA dehydrogenase family protein [Aquabacterium sp.]|uniref:acyl-CoA dehydrogenase family protein n=1 Tax=Aquabacterium sp. TaxID=1872578 RepID=UPI0037843EF8
MWDADTDAQLRDSLARFLAEGRAADPARLWRGLARELGLLGAALPESAGGLGGGFAAHLGILQALGAAMAAEPYLSTAVIGAGVLQRAGSLRAAALLRDVVAGDQLLAWAHQEPGMRDALQDIGCTLRYQAGAFTLHGRKRAVAMAGGTPLLIVSACLAGSGEPVLALVDLGAPGLLQRPLHTPDGLPAAELLFDGVLVTEEALLCAPEQGRAQVERTLDEATLAACAEALGLMQRLITDTIAHLRERRQFGVPLASFQVLQHRLAEMHIAREQAVALTESLVGQLDAAAPQRALAVSAAKVAVNEALRCVGQGAVQLHGAMGVTEELFAARLFRRATQLALMFGSTQQHLRRIDALMD